MLEEKQFRILKKLDELKNTLISMRGDLKLCSKPAQPQQQPKVTKCVFKSVQKPIDAALLGDVVINVHPTNIPYSLLALKNMWNGRLNVNVSVFSHSSVKESEITNTAKEFADKISAGVAQSGLPTLNVTIIWKDVETTQMVASATSTSVYGEVNIIRYLNRVGPSEFLYEVDNHFANLSDTVLDVAYQLSKKHSNKERLYFIQLLSQRLGKSQFYNDSPTLSVADIAVASILKKLFASNVKELPANLSSWLKKISGFAGI